MNNTKLDSTLNYKRAVGLYRTRDEAERVVQGLKDHNYNMDRVSVIAKDTDQVAGHETTKTKEIGNQADKGAATGALAGGALGGVTGLLVGLGTLAIPGIGPILLAGAEATAIATTLAGAGIGAATGGLIGALIGLGIPEERAKVYSDGVSKGRFLVMVTGSSSEIANVERIMRGHNVEEFDIYDARMPQEAPVTEKTAVTADTKDNVKLYEERLIADKERHKAGEVVVGKRVETDTATVSVPVEKERVVIERKDSTGKTIANPNQVDFNDNETIRMDVYEESADIEKQAFVHEEVNVRKEVERDTVDAKETVRREEVTITGDTADVVEKKRV